MVTIASGFFKREYSPPKRSATELRRVIGRLLRKHDTRYTFPTDAIAIDDEGHKAARRTVRGPAVAGQFYPEDPEQLRRTVLEHLSAAEPKSSPPKALIAPHAG